MYVYMYHFHTLDQRSHLGYILYIAHLPTTTKCTSGYIGIYAKIDCVIDQYSHDYQTHGTQTKSILLTLLSYKLKNLGLR